MRNAGSGDGSASPASTPVDAPWVQAALSAVRPEGTVTSVEPIEAGGRRSTLVVRFADADPIVVRHGSNRTAVETEAALLSAVAAETTVPVAAPLGWGLSADGSDGTGDPGVSGGWDDSNGSSDAADETGPDGDGDVDDGWLATRFVGGDDLHKRFVALDTASRRDLAAAFGRFLGELHAAFRFGGYGPIVADGGELRVTHRSDDGDADRDRATAWRDWLVGRGRESLDRLPSEFADVAAAARQRLDAWTVEDAPTPRLFPWDLRPGNALVADGEITAIVDWEAPLAAGAALSVAKAEYLLVDWYVPEEADALRRAFRSGYAGVRPVPTVDDVHRIVAVAEAAVDSHGVVTNPRYPPVGRDEAVRFHRRHLGDAA